MPPQRALSRLHFLFCVAQRAAMVSDFGQFVQMRNDPDTRIDAGIARIRRPSLVPSGA